MLCLQACGSRRLVRKVALLGDGTVAQDPGSQIPWVFTALQTAPALSMAVAVKHSGAHGRDSKIRSLPTWLCR